jgi:hypothetical protein
MKERNEVLFRKKLIDITNKYNNFNMLYRSGADKDRLRDMSYPSTPTRRK